MDRARDECRVEQTRLGVKIIRFFGLKNENIKLVENNH